jgi:hypothetical protein
MKPSCLHPKPCPNLNANHAPLLDIYKAVYSIPQIKKPFIGSGVRYDLSMHHTGDADVDRINAKYNEELIIKHVSGRLKVAPEHTCDHVLNLMRKPSFSLYYDFKKIFDYSSPDYVGHLFERNIDELCDSLDLCDRIDTVAHLTYMHSYCAFSGNSYDFSKHRDKLETLFRKMIPRDVALEVNVSTLWRGLGFAMPDREILSLYRECGGKLVTVGTDSHSPEHIGECIDEGFDLLRSVGLNNVLVVRNGEKTIMKI